MNNVMIDIETLSSAKDAAVVAIGACAFDATEIGETFEVLLDVKLSPGRRDEDTLRWWSERPAEVLERMTSGRVWAKDAVVQLSEFVARRRCEPRVWANSPSFDCVILSTLYGDVGVPVPWNFRAERDYRTLLAVYKYHSAYDNAGVEAIYAERTAHDALSDAVCQARVVQKICRDMGVRL